MKVLELPQIKGHHIVKKSNKSAYTQEELESMQSLRAPKNMQTRHTTKNNLSPRRCHGDERTL